MSDDETNFPILSNSITKPSIIEGNAHDSFLEPRNDLESENNQVAKRAYKNKLIPTQYSVSLPKKHVNVSKKLTLTIAAPKNVASNRNKKPTPLKKAIIQARVESTSDNSKVSVSVDEDDLDACIKNFLSTIKQKQDILWKQNENKARSRRRIVCGMHETTKHLKLKDVRCVIVAKNIDTEVVNGSASDLFHCLRTICLTDNIPLIFASTKKTLSKAVNKFPYTNVIGILRFEGYEEDFKNIAAKWTKHFSHISYHADQSSLFP